MNGYINSFQSLGTVDGPGVRFVVFMQGCNLRCGCCHNPDTWQTNTGIIATPEEVLQKVLRVKDYFGPDGGITVSGGEPLLQADFVYQLFCLCKEAGIHTCLDTSGCILNESVKRLLTVTDMVLLDIKYTNSDDYRQYVGCDFHPVLQFLSYLNDRQIPTLLRQVIIPTKNDTEENILLLKKMATDHPNVTAVELLPFKKICQVKYNKIGIPFPFADLPVPDRQTMEKLNKLLLSRVNMIKSSFRV